MKRDILEIFNENQVADLMHLKYDGSLIVHCDLLDSQIIINCFKNIIFVGDVDVDTIYCGGNLVAKKSFTVKKLKCGGSLSACDSITIRSGIIDGAIYVD
jgi:hypothetical protein